MKKSFIIAGLVVSTGLLAVTQVAHAEEDGRTRSTTGNVNVVGGTTTIIPDPVEPFPGTGPYLEVGDLGISSATNLYFDDIELGSAESKRAALYLNEGAPITNKQDADGEFTADVPVDSRDVYVPGYSVSDRRGTGAGWNLTLQLGEFNQTDAVVGEEANVLRGATLSFPVVTPVTVATATTEADEVPTTRAVTFNAGGDSAVLMSAKVGQGKGLWEARYNSREITYVDGTNSVIAPVELTVPGDNYKGAYQANLTWTLSDEPITEAPGA